MAKKRLSTLVMHAHRASQPFRDDGKSACTYCGLNVLPEQAVYEDFMPGRATCEGCVAGLAWHRQFNVAFRAAHAKAKAEGLPHHEARARANDEAARACPPLRFSGPAGRRVVRT